jgi:hypothetical protein
VSSTALNTRSAVIGGGTEPSGLSSTLNVRVIVLSTAPVPSGPA